MDCPKRPVAGVPLWVALLAMLLLSGTARGQGADPLRMPLSMADVDVENCGHYQQGEMHAPPAARLPHILGLGTTEDHPWRGWQAEKLDRRNDTPETVHYIVAFKKPIPVGTVLFPLSRLSYLKPGAPYPGDPGNEEHWVSVPVPPMQHGIKAAPLPPEVTTRALRLSSTYRTGKENAAPIRIFAARLFNITYEAAGRAEREYTSTRHAGEKTYGALDLLRGRRPWISAGVDDDGEIRGHFITDVQPSWFTMAWEEPREVAAIYSRDNFGTVRLDRYVGPESMNPLLGIEEEWKEIPERLVRSHRRQERIGRWISFTEPVPLRGLRFWITRTLGRHNKSPIQIATIESLLILRDLGEEPVPEIRTDDERPPKRVPYELPADGYFTFAINDTDGRRVRNLVARVERAAGANDEAWDLKNEAGIYTEPGTYEWKAIFHPPLGLRYEMTAYPNVTVHHPENSAWLNGHHGSGGWLADHSPPWGVAAIDDRLVVGALVPESGVGFAVCDLSGKKLWGIHSFDSWCGAKYLAGADGMAYSARDGWAGNYDRDGVWQINLETQEEKPFLIRGETASRKSGVKGIAVRDGRLYLSIRADEPWIQNAVGLAAVDVEHNVPFYPPPRDPKRPYEVVPNPRDDFLRLFRLKGRPPGYAEGHGLIYLESPRGPGSRQHIVLAFNREVPIGSCVYPVPRDPEIKVRVSVLKPDAPYPPDPDARDHWLPFEEHGRLAWDVAIPPEACRTRALRISFVKGVDDELTAAMEEMAAEDKGVGLLTDDGGGDDGGFGQRVAWQGRLEGFQILRRRYRNLFGSATVRTSSGQVKADGTWEAVRQEPLSRSAPAIYLLEWDEPQAVRGLAIKEIDAKLAEVDVWTGPAGEPVPLRGGKHWRQVGSHTPRRRVQHSGFDSHNALARYMNGAVDFGESVTTRAVRLRMVEQWTVNTREGSCAKGGLGLDSTRCRVFGVAPLAYIGGEPPVDPTTTERIEEFDTATAELLREVHVPAPDDIDLGPGGELYAISGAAVVRVDWEGEAETIVDDLEKPTCITFDPEGTLYVYDAGAKRRNIRVYRDGVYQRSIGTPGGYRAGPWDPTRLDGIQSIAAAKDGKLWAVSHTYWPKRVVAWTTAGEYLREYLGPTWYGGGGVLDPGDKRRLFFGPLEFELDWETGTSHLKSLTSSARSGGWHGNVFGERPLYVEGRNYMVNRPRFNRQSVGAVYLYEDGYNRPLAAVGLADAFAPFSEPAIQERLQGKPLTQLEFIWTDRSGDGEVQFEEVEFRDRQIRTLTRFNRDLSIQAGAYRFEVKEFLPDGVPVYERRLIPGLRGVGGQLYRLNNGLYERKGGTTDDPAEELFTAAGERASFYPTGGDGVQPLRYAGRFRPGQVTCQFGVVGHETAAAGDLGEFYVIHTNLGTWNLWTADGLLAGRIFHDFRGPHKRWVFPEHDRRMVLDELTAGQEHFYGWVCRTREDGKYYAVAGHNHASVVEILGLEDFRRYSGTLEVTPEDIKEAQAWEHRQAKRKVSETVKLLEAYRVESPMQPDGRLGDWEGLPRIQLADEEKVYFQLAYDDENLYLAYEVRDHGPLKSSGKQWRRLFKNGGGVELMLGARPGADADRRSPVEGDLRLFMTESPEGLVAVLYQPVAPAAAPEQAWEVVSPVAREHFDLVRRLPEARLVKAPTYRNYEKTIVDGYVLEAAVPLESLGLAIEPGLRLKLDWGVLEADAQGTVAKNRLFWANPMAQILADAPSEARLHPDLWGWVRFRGVKDSGASLSAPSDLMDAGEEDDGLEGLQLEEE